MQRKPAIKKETAGRNVFALDYGRLMGGPFDSGAAFVFLAVHGVAGKVFAVGTTTGLLAIAELKANRTWEAETMLPSAPGALRGVMVLGPSSAYAVGTDGLVLRYDGSTWTSVPSLTTDQDLFAIAAMGRTLIAVGEVGTIWRYDLP